MRKFRGIAAMCTLMACSESTAPTQSARPMAPDAPLASVTPASRGAPTYWFKEWIDFSFVGPASPCTAEDIQVSGRVHVTSTVWNDGSQARIVGHTNMNLVGRGVTSGSLYRIMQITNGTQEVDLSGGPSESFELYHFRAISSTGAPNAYLTVIGTWTFPVSGPPTFEPKRVESVCR